MVNKNFYFSLFFYKKSINPGHRDSCHMTTQPHPKPPTPNIDFMYHIRKMTMGIDLVSLTPPSLVLELGIVL